jgi:hypothetical protein
LKSPLKAPLSRLSLLGSGFLVLKFIRSSKWRTGSSCPSTLEYLSCYFKCPVWFFGLWAMHSFIFLCVVLAIPP